MYVTPFYLQVNGDLLRRDIGHVLSMFTEDRTRENGHKLKEEDNWVCIKGIPLLLDNKTWKGACGIYS